MAGLGVFVRVILVIITKIRFAIKKVRLPLFGNPYAFPMVTKVIFLVNKLTTPMSNKRKRAKSVEDEFQSCEGLEGKENYLDPLDISHVLQLDQLSKHSNRTNAAEKHYWTRIFTIRDGIHYMLEPDEVKPGVYCINDDLEKNKELILDKDSDQDRLAEPIFEPKAWAELYGKEILVKDFEIGQEQLQTYGEMATAIR